MLHWVFNNIYGAFICGKNTCAKNNFKDKSCAILVHVSQLCSAFLMLGPLLQFFMLS